MVSFKRLVWIKSAEQLNYLRDKRRKRTTGKYIILNIIKRGRELRIFQAGFERIHLHWGFCCSSLIIYFFRPATLRLRMKWSRQRDADAFPENFFTSAEPASSNWFAGESKASERRIAGAHLSRLRSLADIRPVISGEPRHVVVYVQHFDERCHGGG